jgi:hypothetical protein
MERQKLKAEMLKTEMGPEGAGTKAGLAGHCGSRIADLTQKRKGAKPQRVLSFFAPSRLGVCALKNHFLS